MISLCSLKYFQKNVFHLNASEYSINGYEVFIPSLESGRGVAIYVKDSYKASLDEDLTFSDF